MKYLITGAGRGLGYELYNQLLASKHEVFAPSSKQWDVRVPRWFSEDERFDRVFVNAAVKDDATALTASPDKVLEILNINAVGALRTVQSVNNNLNHNAKIILLTSQMGSSALTGAITLHGRYGDHYINPTYSIGYRMSKAALNKLAQCLAMDYKERGIAVYAIDPGWPKTDMGGPFATQEVDDCAKSIINLTEQLTLADTGNFYDWNGNKLEW